jgi:FkbM family methyltransferase
MKKLIKKGDFVLDIGANIGYYADIMSLLVGGEGKVHCFEPDKLNFKYLHKVVNGKANVVLNKKAVAEEDGSILIYTSDVINVEHTTYKPEHFDATYSVEKTSIDNYVAQKFPVSFIKMDIQGAELKALEGMKKTLLSNKNIVLMTEIHPYCLVNCNTTPNQIIDFITSLGFTIFLINENSLKELNPADVENFKTDEEYFYNILCARKPLDELNPA